MVNSEKLIYIADDSAVMREILERQIKEAGYQVQVATNGHEVLVLIAVKKPHLIVLDLLMPDMSGQEVLEELHKQQQNIPVIILSADIQKSTREYCMKLGARAHLTKPPEKDELLQAIQRNID